MRLYNFIEVFKTPLDKNYKNVYDEYSTYDEYITFLRKFPHNRVYTYNSTTKSRRDTNGVFALQVSGYDSLELHDYNYILFYTNVNVPHFAFITSVSSLNDGSTSKACELECKFDAWSNNYFSFKSANPVLLTNRATYDNYLNRFYPNELMQNRIPTKKTFIKSLQSTEFVGTTTPRVILWQRILVSSTVDMYYEDQTVNKETFTPYDKIQKTGGLIPCYRVAGVVDVATRRFVKCVVYINGKASYDAAPRTYRRLLTTSLFSTPYFDVEGVNGTYSFSNTLTFTFPRIYSIVQTISGDNEFININIDTESQLCTGSIVIPTGEEEEPLAADGRDWIICTENTTNYNIAWSHEVTLPTLPTTPSRYSTYISSIMESEGIYSEFPFKYYSIIINGEEYALIPEFEQNSSTPVKFTIEQYLDDRIYKSLRIKRNVDVDKTIKAIALKDEMPTRIDQLEQYLNFNRNQLEANYAKRIVTGAGSVTLGIAALAGAVATGGASIPITIAAMGAAGGALSLGSGLINEAINQKAVKSDIANKPDIYSSNENNSLANMYFGDDIVLVYNEVDYTSEVIRSLFTDIHHFGTTSPKYLNAFSRRRDIYDSIVTNEELRVPINDSDREELQSALRTGITFWHIVPYIQSNDRDTILTTMNKQVANICFSAIA